MEYFLVFVILCLVGCLVYLESQHTKQIKIIISAKLSRDVFDFKEANKEETYIEEPNLNEVSLEDMPEDELLRAINKQNE